MKAPSAHPWALLSGFVLTMTVVQLLYKLAGSYSLSHAGLVAGWLLNPYLLGALALLALGMVLWLLTLKRMPLSRAYPWTAAIYVLTPLCSALLFRDALSPQYLIGMGCIVAGIAITAQRQERAA